MKKRSALIKGLVPGLVEAGKIKIGRKGRWVKNKFQLPQKLDHFLITKTSRSEDDNNFDIDEPLMDRLLEVQGGEKLTEIPIVLLYNDIELNFQSRYACYRGRQRWCSGDGELADRWNDDAGRYEERLCPCELADPDAKGELRCKMNGCLSCLIQGAETVGRVWKFRTTSYNTILGITSSLMLIKRITGGALAGIPLCLTMQEKAATKPDGGAVTVYVVNIEYRGSPDQLKEVGYNLMLGDATHMQRIEHVEAEAKKLLSHDAAIDDADVVEEFYPEQAGQVAVGNAGKETPVLAEPVDAVEDAGGGADAETAQNTKAKNVGKVGEKKGTRKTKKPPKREAEDVTSDAAPANRIEPPEDIEDFEL